MSELKNCPFCGGEVYRNHDILVIDCVKCERRFDFEGDIGIADWNRRPLEDALSKRIAELERTVDDLRGELAQSDRASDVTRIAELEAAINRACSGCWAKDAPDAAQCRLCGLKKETKGGVRNDRLAPLTDNGGCVAK